MSDLVRVFVGADRSQALAVKVLEHSIKRHASVDVEVTGMIDLPVRRPIDPRNWQRTNFSFSRFCIPKLCGYQGKAVYMDADMLVFQDIKELWNTPFDGAKVVIQESVEKQTTEKVGAPAMRKKQCSVMLIDCARCDWEIEKIVDGFDEGRYNYDQLMSEMCILAEKDIRYGVPFKWNSLEYYDRNTCLLHYTDVHTQPWTSPLNALDYLWLDEIRLMLKNGSLRREELEQEVKLGYFRPSLLRDVRYGKLVPGFMKKAWATANKGLDAAARFVPHKEVYENKRKRLQYEKEYLARLQKETAASTKSAAA